MLDRIESIFHEARALPPDQRSEYLASACGEDLALRNKVDVLLEVDASLGTSDDDATTMRFAQAPRGPSEQPGQQIGRYKLLELLGEGGFGTVWAAEQREPVKRRVALKFIKLGMDTKQVIARFEAERQALAMMDNPNIAKVLDAGATDTGCPYFAMELVKGVPIIEYCDREKLDTKARLDLFMKVCHAIQHAHQKGIIHRGIKPSRTSAKRSRVSGALGDDHPDTLNIINNMGFLLRAQGKLAEAEPYWREALECRRRVLGADHPDTLDSISNLGVLLRELGRLDEANALGEEAVRRSREALGDEHWRFGVFLVYHARTLAAMGRHADAEQRGLKAYAMLYAALGENHERSRDAAKHLTDLYTAWHEAEPDAGHDAKAAEWRAKLEEAGETE